MRPEPETITLGGKSWLIRPLTLRQVREFTPLVAPLVQQTPTDTNGIDLFTAMIAAALRRDHAADTDPDALLDLEATLPEIRAAQAVILRLSGLAKTKEIPEGEVQAEPAAEITGGPSMAG
jgi:hypothetical protein